MTLINCPECGKEISDKSEACPHCGQPIAKKKKFNLQRLFAVLVVIISTVALIISKGSGFWALLFFAGIAWFIVLRIVKD